MTFSCSICSERLDRPPAGVGGGDVNVASTPCGHVFHTYCIQKWLTGGYSSAKVCPCCRKSVPGAVVLPLYPTAYDTSYDESSQGSSSGGGTTSSSCDHSHFNAQINSLKTLTEKLRDDIGDMEVMMEAHRASSADFQKKYESERLRSESYLFKWKEVESYKSYAEQQERLKVEAEQKLEQYQSIDLMVRNVQEDVTDDMMRYMPNAESLKRVLETYHVIQKEYKKTVKKLEGCQVKQEKQRQDYSRLNKVYSDLKNAHTELKRVHGQCDSSNMNNHTIVLDDSPMTSTSAISSFKRLDDSTPLRLEMDKDTKTLTSTKGGTNADLSDVDSEVRLIKPFSFKKKATSKRRLHEEGGLSLTEANRNKSLKTVAKKDKTASVQPHTDSSSRSTVNRLCDTDDEDFDLPLRGSIPGLTIELKPSRRAKKGH